MFVVVNYVFVINFVNGLLNDRYSLLVALSSTGVTRLHWFAYEMDEELQS